MATPPFIGVFAATYGPYLGTGTAPGTITPGPTVGTPGILVLQTTGMANSLRSLATVTGSLPVEAALVKNADGSAIGNPTFADCTYDSASGKWICDTPAPAGTYPAGAQLFRLKGSSPAVTAASLAGATVTGAATPQLAAPTGLSGVALSGGNGLSWNQVVNSRAYRLQRAPVTNGTAGSFGNVYEDVATSKTDTTATASAVYDYRVKTLAASGYADSDYSTPVRVTTAAAPAYTGPPAFGVAFGDSTTFGYSPPDGEKPYTYWLQQSWQNGYLDVANNGYSGATTSQLLGHVQNSLNARPAGHPALVAIMCGVNNYLHPENTNEAARTPAGTVDEIFQIHAAFRAATGLDTLCLSPLRTSNAGANAFLEQVRTGLLARWQAAGCFAYVDTYNIPQFNPPTPDFYNDEYHPNIPGRLVLGEFIRPAFADWATSKGIPVPAYTNIGASGSTPPAAPAVTFDPDTRRLNATHALGTSSLEVSAGGGAYAAFGDFVQVDGNQHPAQYYVVRTVALGSRPAGSPAYSPAIAAATISTRQAVVWKNVQAPVTANGNNLSASGPGGTANSTLAATGGRGAFEFTGYDVGTDIILGFNPNAAAGNGYDGISGIRVVNGGLNVFGDAWYGQQPVLATLQQTDVVRVEYNGNVISVRVNGTLLKSETAFAGYAANQQLDVWVGSPTAAIYNVYIESPALQPA